MLKFSLLNTAFVALSACILLTGTACDRESNSSVTQAASDAASPEDATEHVLQEAFTLLIAGKTAEAVKVFDGAMVSKGFALIPEAHRYSALESAGEAEENLGNYAKAHALFVRSSESTEADDDAWQHRLATAYELQDFVDSARCLTIIAQRWPTVLKEFRGQTIWSVQASLGDDDKSEALRLELFNALYDAHWRDALMNPSPVWRDLTRMLLARNQVAKALEVAAEVDDTRVALSMRVDKRFDGITKGNPTFDIDRLAAKNLEKARREVKQNPDSLFSRILLISALLDLTQYKEALRIADETAALAKHDSGAKRFRDFDEHFNWLLNIRSRALFRLGRVDEAVGELERAAGKSEGGQTNVSQVINLGLLYDKLGRPVDAMAILSKVGTMSPFGRMQMEFARLWASIQLHDSSATLQHMDYLRAHRADAMPTWASALVLNGNEDEAAQGLISRLQSEHWRSDALENIQDYAGIRRLPAEVNYDRQWSRIYARPDVRKAIQQVGRLESFHIDPSRN